MDTSKERQWEMLALLYRHGADADVLRKVVPKWSLERLEHMLRCQRGASERRAAKREKMKAERERAAASFRGPSTLDAASNLTRPTCPKSQRAITYLQEWQQHTQNVQNVQGTVIKRCRKRRLPREYDPGDYGALLTKAMLIISQEEKHPTPRSSADPDYKEIYRYLSQVLGGQEPTQLSQGSAAKVLEMIEKVQRIASRSLDVKKTSYHLSKKLRACLQPFDKMEADPAPSTSSQGGEASNTEEEEDCPLFQELDEEAEAEQSPAGSKTPTHDDPCCEKLKDRLEEEGKKKQAEASVCLTRLAGVNPFMLPPHLLLKPMDYTVKTLLGHE